MAWALKEPMSFGFYWPDGEFVGWDEQLYEYFETEISRAEKEQMLKKYYDREGVNFGKSELWNIRRYWKIQLVESMVGEIGDFVGQEAPLDPRLFPRVFKTVRTYKSLAAMIETESRIVAVNEALKNIIERLEPGVHQFHPFRIMMPRGREYPEPYHVLRIGRVLDSFIPVEGTYMGTLGRGKLLAIDDTKKYLNKLAFSREKISGAHLWREKVLSRPNILMSDTLKQAIDDVGLRIFRHHKVKEA